MTDATATELPVCLVGGEYAVGDVALEALSAAVRGIPVEEMVASPDDPRIAEIGAYGVYWQYVRANPNNRAVLQDGVRAWWSEHEDELAWHDDVRCPLGGYYATAAEAAAETALQLSIDAPAAER